MIERLCFLKLSEEERKKFEREIEEILKAFEKLDELNVEEELIVHPIEIKNILREDIVKDSKTRYYLEKYFEEDNLVIGPKTVLEE